MNWNEIHLIWPEANSSFLTHSSGINITSDIKNNKIKKIRNKPRNFNWQKIYSRWKESINVCCNALFAVKEGTIRRRKSQYTLYLLNSDLCQADLTLAMNVINFHFILSTPKQYLRTSAFAQLPAAVSFVHDSPELQTFPFKMYMKLKSLRKIFFDAVK